MKNILKNKVKSLFYRYKYNTILTLIIFILFLMAGYSKVDINYELYFKDNKLDLQHRIYEQNNEHYIHIEDLITNFKDNVYDDKISGKLIITTYDNLVKINKNDRNYVIDKDNEIYINLAKIMMELDNNTIVSKNKIFVSDLDFVEGEILINRVEVLDKQTGNILCLLNKHSKVKIFVDESIKNQTEKIVNIEASLFGNTYYGYVLKKNVAYKYSNVPKSENNKKVLFVKADSGLMTSTNVQIMDYVAINMYRLSSVNGLKELEYTNNVPQNVKQIATINNGQKSSNYDVNIVSGMLNSEVNRYEIIKKILEGVKNIAGVNLDFSNFKSTDKNNYTQFVKELAAVMHKNNKILVVNIPSTQYIDVGEIVKFADYIILQAYSERTMSSKNSGPISSITYVKEMIQDTIAKVEHVDKIILEIPSYTILWTERRGTVINAEQYNMKTMQSYLKENNIPVKLDKVSGQNYINYTKGITTYKMWLEDLYSINEKAKLVVKYNLAGMSIYKSGMELKEIYDSISKVLK